MGTNDMPGAPAKEDNPIASEDEASANEDEAPPAPAGQATASAASRSASPPPPPRAGSPRQAPSAAGEWQRVVADAR
eukprot:11860404-Alexandrium_andersonii.AAC.1